MLTYEETLQTLDSLIDDNPNDGGLGEILTHVREYLTDGPVFITRAETGMFGDLIVIATRTHDEGREAFNQMWTEGRDSEMVNTRYRWIPDGSHGDDPAEYYGAYTTREEWNEGVIW